MKLTVEYNPIAGHVTKDGEAEQWVDDKIHSMFFAKEKLEDRDDWVVTVASALLIDFFRLRLCEGVINVDQIAFTFDGKTLEHNEYGRITHWPKGYCDIPIYPMERLLTLAHDKAKKKKKWAEMKNDNELTGLQDISKRN